MVRLPMPAPEPKPNSAFQPSPPLTLPLTLYTLPDPHPDPDHTLPKLISHPNHSPIATPSLNPNPNQRVLG